MLTRRKFIKNSTLASSITAFYMTSPLLSANDNEKETLNWDKSVCRFCSIGCGLLVGTKDEDNKKRIVSIKGDDSSSVNNGELCIKGYHNHSVLLGKNRLTTPLLKMKHNKYDKDGVFTAISWEKAFDIMEIKAKESLKEYGVDGVGVFTSGNASIEEGYTISKLFKAGFRSNNIANSSSYTDNNSTNALNTIYGTNIPSGSFNDIEITDTFVSWGVNLAETYPILFSRINKTKLKKKDNFKFINITTIQNRTSLKADTEILIKPASDILLINYITRELIFNNSKNIDWDFIKRHAIFAVLGDKNKNKNGDRYEQWETSFYEYKKSLKKYTLDYVAPLLKEDYTEDIAQFKNKLQQLSQLYIQNNKRILSYWSSGVNKQKYGFEINLALNSLHLVLNKHSKQGCGAFPLTGQSSANGTSIGIGTYSNKLPANMYIKYKEHRIKAETIWNIPEGTLNPIASNNQHQLFKNIYQGITKFIWINSSNPFQHKPKSSKFINYIKKSKDLFIVTSDCYHTKSTMLSDLVLPTASNLEKFGSLGSAEKKIQQTTQQIIAPEIAMSDIWQWLEFSKRFKISEVWTTSKLTNGQVLKDVIIDALKMGYEKRTTLYNVLFSNNRSWNYHLITTYKQNILNSEVLGDNRNILGSDGKIFVGYNFYIQKYLFEEYRLFGTGNGFDVAPFEKYKNHIGLKYPYIFNKETTYIFNTKYDIYAKKASNIGDTFIFYGKMGGKALPYGDLNHINDKNKKSLKYRAKIFSIPYKSTKNILDFEYNTLLISIKLIEQFNTGTLTMQVPQLATKSYAYLSKETAKNKNLKDGDLVMIYSTYGKLEIIVKIDKRFNLQNNTIAIAMFDKNIDINNITKNINNTFVNIKKIIPKKNIKKKS